MASDNHHEPFLLSTEEAMNREELRERYDYHPDGYLTYRYNTPGGGRGKIGAKVGSIDQRGYVVTKIKGKHHSIHQLIYIYHYGEIVHQLDHINNDKTDNRIENLRDIPQSENCLNRLDTKMNGGLHPRSLIRRNKRLEGI